MFPHFFLTVLPLLLDRKNCETEGTKSSVSVIPAELNGPSDPASSWALEAQRLSDERKLGGVQEPRVPFSALISTIGCHPEPTPVGFAVRGMQQVRLAKMRSLQCRNPTFPFRRRKMAPPNVEVLIPRTFRGKREFASLIKLGVLGLEDYPRLVEWAQRNKKEAGSSKSEKEMWGWKQRLEKERGLKRLFCWFWTWEKETTSQGILAASGSQKRQGNQFTPKASRRNAALPTCWLEPCKTHVGILTSRL